MTNDTFDVKQAERDGKVILADHKQADFIAGPDTEDTIIVKRSDGCFYVVHKSNVCNLPAAPAAAAEHVVAVQMERRREDGRTYSVSALQGDDEFELGGTGWGCGEYCDILLPRTEIEFKGGKVVAQDGVELIAAPPRNTIDECSPREWTQANTINRLDKELSEAKSDLAKCEESWQEAEADLKRVRAELKLEKHCHAQEVKGNEFWNNKRIQAQSDLAAAESRQGELVTKLHLQKGEHEDQLATARAEVERVTKHRNVAQTQRDTLLEDNSRLVAQLATMRREVVSCCNIAELHSSPIKVGEQLDKIRTLCDAATPLPCAECERLKGEVAELAKQASRCSGDRVNSATDVALHKIIALCQPATDEALQENTP